MVILEIKLVIGHNTVNLLLHLFQIKIICANKVAVQPVLSCTHGMFKALVFVR